MMIVDHDHDHGSDYDDDGPSLMVIMMAFTDVGDIFSRCSLVIILLIIIYIKVLFGDNSLDNFFLKVLLLCSGALLVVHWWNRRTQHQVKIFAVSICK